MLLSFILTPMLSVLVLASAFALPSTAQAQIRENQRTDTARTDSALLDMAQAYRQSDSRRLATLLPQVRNSVLEPWGAYWELSARLDSASATEIQDFLSRYSGTYQEDKLRSEWLLLLGDRKDWSGFFRALPAYRMRDDKSIQCYQLLGSHLQRNGDPTAIAAQVTELWLSLRETDEGCAAAAQQLLSDTAMRPYTAWVRARLGMETDRLRVATQAVGLLDERWAKTVAQVYQNPAKYLADKLTALRPQTRELVSLALIRLAYQDPAQAAQELQQLRWRAQLTQEERSWIWGVIGKRAAQRLQYEASDYFAKGQFDLMHEDHLAWAARAALRTGNWAQVQAAITAMPERQRADPTWTYWHARALLAGNRPAANPGEAQRMLERIAGVRGFYEQLALEDLGQRITVPERPAPLTEPEKEAARQNPGLRRALYAISIGLRSEGVREWNYTTNLHQSGGMDDRSLLAAADLACRAEVWDRCINSSERTKTIIDMEQRFPMPFKAAVLAQTQKIGLDPAYVYGLIRQESRFIMDAKSSVGASGLMQVMPATARWTAKKIGLTGFQGHQINDRDINLAIGTGYLKLVLESFEGSMPLATAAYNAGPSRPRAWRGQAGARTLDAAIWAENIPFSETRDYVKKVLANTTNYAALITGQPQSLKARLGAVGPRDGDIADTAADLP
ncbi:transglycosylase SLT domain-containing protein [Rhodoferax sp.]|jgi:soluble lytic murein transglycosylase|uniref:lytic transglycosylase domain-containing protein n=1 Tax=Rhodoferax sp. TaxID=50421 RepID=UPI00378457A7